jgi:hypothetical protein
MVSTPTNVRQPALTPITVKLPDGTNIVSTHTCQLKLPLLPAAATQGHIFPSLASHALISVGVLCGNGCNITFLHNGVDIARAGQLLYSGQQQTNDLWTLNLEPQLCNIGTPLTSNAAVESINSSTLPDLINFMHASCFSPVKSTLIKAIANGHPHLKTDLSHYALFLYDYAHNCTELYLIIYSLNLCHTIYLLLVAHSTTNLRNTF